MIYRVFACWSKADACWMRHPPPPPDVEQKIIDAVTDCGLHVDAAAKDMYNLSAHDGTAAGAVVVASGLDASMAGRLQGALGDRGVQGHLVWTCRSST